jgi:hypothetical protein
MAAVAKLEAQLTILGEGGTGPFELLHSLSAEAWAGPLNTVIPTGTSAQSIILLGIQGLSSITSFLITTDQQITVFYNGAVTGMTINPGGFHAFSDTNITAVSLTNVSGVAANVRYAAAGNAG